MRSILTLGAAALALSVAAPAFAQDTEAQQPAASSSAPSSSSGSAMGSGADASATASTLAVGATVKDNTGASIGTVTDVKADAAGKQVATIKMGADTFAVETDKLAIADGSATINATQAELKAMLQK
jgi:sporulation protein YlmC with PRC-barrel domain